MSAESDKVAVPSQEAAAVMTTAPEAAATAPAPAAAAAPAAEAAPAASAEAEKPKAVFVENLSPSVTTKMLNEFFSLCGPIESITVRPKPNAEDGTLEAIVFFESSSAADTAVLLTNAILVDRNISITYFNGSNAKDAEDAAATADSSEDGPSVWAQILAAGYMIGDNIRGVGDGIQNAAKEVDEKYGVSKGFEETVGKIDQTLGISTKAAALSNVVHQKSQEFHVSEKLDAVGNKVSEATEYVGRAASGMLDSAAQNQYVSSAWNTLSGWGSYIVAGWTSLTDEAAALYAQQTGKAAPAPAAAETNPAGEGAAATADPDNVSVPKDASEPAPAVVESSDEVKIPSEPAKTEEKPAQ